MAAMSVIVAVVSALLALCNAQLNYVNVTTSLGTVTGLQVTTDSIKYFSFRGIPYAKVTTRFKAPTPIENWASLVMATDDGPVCVQPSLFGYPLQDPVEDCLILNVYTPQLPQSSSSPKLPVMVFIHGGGFIAGTSSSQVYGPEFFMAENKVVLITFNYRLGIFGFLCTGTQDAPGNAGMKDQVEALRFVKNQISYFGGDPNSITVFGESAGAASVIHHILSPMSNGLFHRAIAQSGSALADWTYGDSSAALSSATVVARNLGCDTGNTTLMVKCLRAVSVSILRDMSLSAVPSEDVSYLLSFVPVIETKSDEDVFLADKPANLLNKLNTAVPLIIGTNKDEGLFFLPGTDDAYAAIDKNLGYLAPRDVIKRATKDQVNSIGKQLREYYFNNGPVNRSTVEGLANLQTDRLFMYSTAQTVRKLVEKKNAVYLYHFAYSGHYKRNVVTIPGYSAVVHGEDLGYFFYSPRYNNTDLNKTTTDDYKTMQKMVKLWIAFALTGTLSNSTDQVVRSIQWPQITNASELNYLEMETEFTSAPNYYKDRLALWDRITNLQKSSALHIKPIIFLNLLSISLIFKSFTTYL